MSEVIIFPNDWRPISTVPKDGRPVELKDKWGETGVFMWGKPTGFRTGIQCWVEYGNESTGHSPAFMTHWRKAAPHLLQGHPQ